MKKRTAITIGLLWLLLLLVASTPASSPPSFLVPHAEAAENTWTTKTPMPTPRAAHGVAVVNGKIYVIGGDNSYILGQLKLGTNEMYDPATNTWTTKTSMPTPRSSFGIAVYQNKIYVIGGKATHRDYTGANEVYDPATDTWETKTSMLTSRMGLCAKVVDGKIYLIGGSIGGQYHSVSVNEVYDPATDSWTTKASIPTGVYAYASAVVDNKIYVIGGHDAVLGHETSYNLTQVYDPETDTWVFGKSIPVAVWGVAAGATTGVMAPKRIYIPCKESNYVYDPEKDVWTTGTPMPTPRFGFSVAVVNDVLYAIGGYGGDNYRNENEQYTPIGYGTPDPSYVPPTDSTAPEIAVLSPENKTYTVNKVSLTFTVSEPTSWMGYSLDSQANVTISGNITLTELSEGSHNLTVYANDTFGNIGTSETIYFSIKTEPFPTVWIVAAIAIIAIGVAAPLVYFRKIKKTTGKAEK